METLWQYLEQFRGDDSCDDEHEDEPEFRYGGGFYDFEGDL